MPENRRASETSEKDADLRFRDNQLILEGGETLILDHLETITGALTRDRDHPPGGHGRFGDVKYIAAIGAFLGWKAVLFTICSASVIGCVAALAGVFIAKDKAGSRASLRSFLALGAVIWIFGGDAIWEWYFGMFHNDGMVLSVMGLLTAGNKPSRLAVSKPSRKYRSRN